jgi:sterol desaturase/sphingolipid hydroxylase (fatty acid hydroxylase superfamily)
MDDLLLFAIPGFVLTLLAEIAYLARRPGYVGYTLRDTAASLTMGVGYLAIAGVAKLGVVPLMAWVYQHRWLDLPHDGWVWVASFFADDLVYYLRHRAGHEIRWFWAAHVNHHSSRHYNLSTALRQSWTAPFTSLPFTLILPWIGVPVEMVLTHQAISLVYQYWVHLEWVGPLGPLEWVFNTPSQHRVHHARNPRYLDRNYAGILCVWDRLFGTFEHEREPVDFGLVTQLDTHHPVRIAFHEWVAIARDLRGARSLWEAFWLVFGPPGWRADGDGLTTANLRARDRRR